MSAVVEERRGDAEVGRQLRRLRRERQLSQADLGGPRFSGSYVSHVEKGRRRLSSELVEYFADRLHVAPEEITRTEPSLLDDRPAPTVADADRVLAHQEVQRALEQHQFARAARTADRARRDALARGDRVDAWSLALVRSRALFEQGDYDGAWTNAAALAEDPLSADLAHLRVEALLLAARAARAAGELKRSSQLARQAQALVGAVGGADLEAETLAVLVGALVETDDLSGAVAAASDLAALVPRVESDHVRGLAEWIVGNVDFLTGSVEEGAHRHAEAARLLRPEVDLRLWGRFRKASAEMRLQNAMTTDVAPLLSQAGDALRIVGNDSDLTELRLDEARLGLLEGDTDRARRLTEFALGEESLARAAHSRAQARALLGEIEETDGRGRPAAAAFLAAALAFEEAGSYRRSVQMWRRHAAALG